MKFHGISLKMGGVALKLVDFSGISRNYSKCTYISQKLLKFHKLYVIFGDLGAFPPPAPE